MDAICLNAHAKINIGLNIISKRPDHYHNIETIFQQIDLHDLVAIKRTDGSEITVRSNDRRIPEDQGNICYQAAKLLQHATGITEGIEIEIDKRIPIAAGLGGGSSDAASVIMGLLQLWQIELSKRDLLELAMKLGADVYFFLNGGTALATGVGEILARIALPFNFHCVLILPNIEISSTWAYRNFNFSLTKIKKSVKLSQILNNRFDFASLKNLTSNDLEGVVFQRYPLLMKLKETLYRKGAFFASMSGSGSTIYGLFHNYETAKEVMKTFPEPFQIILAQPVITKGHL